MQRASFREQRSKSVSPKPVPLHIAAKPNRIGSQTTAEAGIREVVSLLVILRRKRLRVVRESDALLSYETAVPANDPAPALESAPAPRVVRPVISFEEVEPERPSNPHRRLPLVGYDATDIRERLHFGGLYGKGEDLAIGNTVLQSYVRFVLGFTWGFRKFIGNRIAELQKTFPSLKMKDREAQKEIALADLRREVNDELRDPRETFQVQSDILGWLSYRSCHLKPGVRQPYFIAVDAETYTVAELWLPGAFGRAKKCRRSRQREFRLDKGRRGRKPILVCVKR